MVGEGCLITSVIREETWFCWGKQEQAWARAHTSGWVQLEMGVRVQGKCLAGYAWGGHSPWKCTESWRERGSVEKGGQGLSFGAAHRVQNKCKKEQAALWGRGRGLVGNVNSPAVPIPDLPNQGLQECGPGRCVLTSPPGNSDLKLEFENHWPSCFKLDHSLRDGCSVGSS